MSRAKTHFAITGHIDHGKSTFAGRLLLELGAIPGDKLENLKRAAGTGKLEYAYLTDALADERKKGITIGVSQIFFKYEDRDFVFIDAPGHFEFIQNMITGASRADVAFLLVDISEGVKESTLRHLNMLSFLNVSKIVVIINKMDLVQYSQILYLKLVEQLNMYFAKLHLSFSEAIPVAAYFGENLVVRSEKMPWYYGALVGEVLVRDYLPHELNSRAEVRFVVHDIYGNHVFGELLSGDLTTVRSCFVHQNPVNEFLARLTSGLYQGARMQSFLKPETIMLKRGDLVIEAAGNLRYDSIFEARLIWFGSSPVAVQQPLSLRLAKQETEAIIQSISSVIDSSSLNEISNAGLVQKGQLIKCTIKLSKELSFDTFENDVTLGRFILLSGGEISGAGKII